MHNTPHYTFSDVDLGSHKVTVARNPKDGTASPVMISPVALSPYQKGMLDVQRYGIDTNASMNRERNDIARTELEYTRDQNLREWENPNQTLFTDENGNVHMIHPRTGRATSVTDESGNQVRGTSVNAQVAREYIKSLTDQEKELTRALSQAQHNHFLATTEEEHNSTQAEVDRITNELNKVKQQKEEFMGYVMPQRTQTTPTNPQPTAKTVSESVPQVIVTAMGATSPDVRQPETPQLPATPTTPPAKPTTQNFTDVTSFLGDRSTWQGITQPQTPTTTPTPQPKPPAKQRQPRTTQGNMRDFTLSDDMTYDPVRDKNIPESKIFSPSHFRNYIKAAQDDQRFAHMSTEELIEWAYRIGIRIDPNKQ